MERTIADHDREWRPLIVGRFLKMLLATFLGGVRGCVGREPSIGDILP